MRYELFVERVMDEIMPLLPDDVKSITQIPVMKNNSKEYTGLCFFNEQNISPTIYLNPYYYQYLDGRSFEAILADIVQTYEGAKCEKDFDVERLKNWDEMKWYIVRKVVNYDENREMLSQMPHKQIEDLAVVYQIFVTDMMEEQGYATVAIKDEYLKMWDVSLEELDTAAVSNTRRILPIRMDNLAYVYSDLSGVTLPFLEEMKMYVLTNKQMINGAVHVLDKEVMESIKDELGEDVYYVIPSSIHEVILFPYTEEFDFQQIEEMIREVNETQLTEEEILSNRAYIIDAKEGIFMLAYKYKDYKKEQELKLKQQEMERDMSKSEQKPKL